MVVSDVSATVPKLLPAPQVCAECAKTYFVCCISSYLVIILIDKKIIADIFGNEELRLSFFLPKVSTVCTVTPHHGTYYT